MVHAALRAVRERLTLRNAVVVAVAALALAGTVLAQLASIIVFDGTGLDTAVPDAVFVSVVPAVLVALPPAALAAALDGGRRGLSVWAAVWVAALGVSVLTAGAFRVCAC